MLSSRRRRAPVVFAAAVLLHALALMWLLRERRPDIRTGPIRESQLVFVRTPPRVVPPLVSPVIPRVIPRVPRANPPDASQQKKTDNDNAPPVSNQAAPPVIAADQPSVSPADPLAQSRSRIDMESLVKQAGKADRESRPEGENDQYGPVSGSMQAVLSRAFTEAKLAVPPKWYEAARIELFSAPNDPKKIYQIKTAFGTYCLFYPDPRKIAGGAQASQPRAGNCPVRF